MTTWIVSDHHFNHANIVELSNRPFTDWSEMNDAMIDAWNNVVGRKDRVFVLGDFGMDNRYGTDIEHIFKSLHGEKHLVIGNHDEQNKRILTFPWATQTQIVRIKENGRRAIACHYPLLTWLHPSKNVMLHGHSHNNIQPRTPRTYDVGVDNMLWRESRPFGEPWNFEVLVDILHAEDHTPVDHH
jgi:calcineurin-like phosphoesterase family protein